MSVGRSDGLAGEQGKQASEQGKQGVNVNRENTDHAKREADNPDEPRGPEVTGSTSEAASLCERRKRLLLPPSCAAESVGRREERSVAV